MADDDLNSASPWAALATATLAGLSTTLGGIIAIARPPAEGDLAFLLGSAIGVMGTVSLELWIAKAWDRGAFGVTIAVLLGAVAFWLLDNAIPSVNDTEDSHDMQLLHLEGKDTEKGVTAHSHHQHIPPTVSAIAKQRNPAALLRLGLLMALTMTLHNLPEGIAVAFSSGTKIGPLIAVAIAIHNIPEGVIVALPIYAATGSPARALGLATLSGLSETLGAAIALFVLRPFVQTLAHLDYVLAGVAGVMLSVCVLELGPEAKRCRRNERVVQGVLAGSAVMGFTLFMGI
jgi:ZIP family zinc transporter